MRTLFERRPSNTWRGRSSLVAMVIAASIGVAAAQITVPVHVQADPTTGTAPLTVQLSATPDPATVTSGTYRWEFGDGSSGSGQSITHVFAQPRAFTIRVSFTGTYGGEIPTTAQGVGVIVVTVRPPSTTLEISPAALSFDMMVGGGPSGPQGLTLTASGPGQIAWALKGRPPHWLRISRVRGTVSASNSDRLKVAIDQRNLAPGSYSAQLQFRTGEPGGVTGSSSTAVQVALHISPVPPKPKPAPTFPWMTTLLVLGIIGATALVIRVLRHPPSRDARPAPTLQVNLRLESGRPSVHAGRPLLSRFVRVRLRLGNPEVRLSRVLIARTSATEATER